VWDETSKTAIDTVDIVALDVVIDLTVDGIDYRCGKYNDFDAGMVEIEPCGVECTPHVFPFGRANHSLVAKAEHLAAHDDIKPAFC
jgi:hypothetical protein